MPAVAEEALLWTSIREQLGHLDSLRTEIGPLQEEYERARSAWASVEHPTTPPSADQAVRPLDHVTADLHPRLQQAHDLSDNA